MQWMKRLYDWVLHWAETPYGVPALFILAFVESSFFIIPPDVLLIALALSVPTRAFRFALYCSLGSVLGGMFGYFIGMQFFDTVGKGVLDFYGVMDKYDYIAELYNRYSAWAVGIAGFTPIPYKVFTIAAGACKINFPVFVTASAISRSARFFMVAGLLYFFGPPIKSFIDRYFNILSVVFVIMLIGGFALMKILF